jgi:hypothetical protein
VSDPAMVRLRRTDVSVRLVAAERFRFPGIPLEAPLVLPVRSVSNRRPSCALLPRASKASVGGTNCGSIGSSHARVSGVVTGVVLSTLAPCAGVHKGTLRQRSVSQVTPAVSALSAVSHARVRGRGPCSKKLSPTALFSHADNAAPLGCGRLQLARCERLSANRDISNKLAPNKAGKVCCGSHLVSSSWHQFFVAVPVDRQTSCGRDRPGAVHCAAHTGSVG